MIYFNYFFRSLFLLSLLHASGQCQQKEQVRLPQLGTNSIRDVIAAMTLQEKAEIVIGAGHNNTPSAFSDGSMIGRTDFRIPGAAGATNAVPRLGIPAVVMVDGPAGVRINPRRKGESKTYFATAFPVGTTLASTWNPAIVESVGKAFGNEVAEYGADIILAPGVNIQRNPLGGRNFEYYSEDPLVTGKIAAAMIRGLQSNGIGTSIKHFVANNQETNRSTINEIITERALREIYLKGFRIAIDEAKPWAVMSSYNLVNGVHTSEREDLLSTVLRDEWHYKGMVMTDWGGSATNLDDQMNAGNDLIMAGSARQIAKIVSMVKHDSLDVKVLDRNVERVLQMVLKSPTFLNRPYSNNPDFKLHAEISRNAAAEGMVLLKNTKNTLPLAKPVKQVCLLGNISYNLIPGGMGSGEVNKAYTISLAQGLTAAGYLLHEPLKERYQRYATNWRNVWREMTVSDQEILMAAAQSEIAILTIGRNSGETKDRSLDTNYVLKPTEKDLIERAAIAFHQKGKKLIVVLNICGAIDTKGWRDLPDAILLAWQPGQEGGYAIADILSGKINPSGKLATTFAENYTDVSSARNFPGTATENQKQVIYKEDIYIGYRYFDSFKIKPAYEFGYGLSYTTFSIAPLKLSSTIFKDAITVTTKVTNTGKTAGKQVVQIYITAPNKLINKPVQELKAFAKTKLLQPGETEMLTFRITTNDLASFYNDKNAWIADQGRYLIKAATSSKQIRQSAMVMLPKPVITEQVHQVLRPTLPVNAFKPAID